ncbi:MAG: IS66 family insertion sequence element accessory protein TnpB [Spirochaetales bacterium]|nr:IS66 family insertion sequence element accessory protein TnpB [Spirochaetales bacterium]
MKSRIGLSLEWVVHRHGKIDLRKGVNGLSILIQNIMQNDPFSKILFLSCKGQRTQL